MKTWFGKFVAQKICETGRGNKCACEKIFAKASLYASVSKFHLVDADGDKEHPNQMPFIGTLLILDEPSNKPPHGSQGHRILVPRKAAEKNIKSLIGQGLNYSPSMDEHAPRRKVGVITDAWIDDNKVKVKGWVWKKDFPEAERDLKQGRLGMSMELANVYVRDENSDVWYLEDFVFTGATVLRKDAAAYTGTSLAANAAVKEANNGGRMKKPVTEEKKTKKVEAAAGNDGDQGRMLAAAVGDSVSEALKPLVNGFNNLVSDMSELKEMFTIQAAAKHDDDDEEMSAAKHEEDDEEMAAAHDDDEDDEEMSAARQKDDGEDDDEDQDQDDDEDGEDDDELEAMEDLQEKAAYRKPGEVNKGAKNKGSQTAVEKVGASSKGVFPKLVKAKGISAGAAIMIKDLVAQAEKRHRRQVRQIQAEAEQREQKLVRKLRKVEAQVERFAELESRRTIIPVELTNLAAKANVDLNEYRQAGAKVPVEVVDRMFAASGLELDPVQKITMKNRLQELGLLEEGVVERPWNQRQLQ